MATKKQNSKSNNSSRSTGIGVGAGIAAGLAVAGLASVYFLYGTKTGEKKRKQVKGWALRMKADVLDKLNTLKDVNEDTYKKVIDSAVVKYQKLKDVDMSELKNLASEMYGHWNAIKSEIQEGKGEVKSAAKTAKKVKRAIKAKPKSN